MLTSQETLSCLGNLVEDSTTSTTSFARELKKKMQSQFSYLLNNERDFQPVFWVATYLSPLHHVLLSSDVDKMREVREFLKSESVIFI